MSQLPLIISVDDHLVEPADLWVSQAPSSLKGRVPHVERGGAFFEYKGGVFKSVRDDVDGLPCDWWVADGTDPSPTTRVASAVSWAPEDRLMVPATFDEMLPGCHDREARLADMFSAGIDGSLCFPSYPRFAGTQFLHMKDRELALWCVRAYNDWMLEHWCSGPAEGHLFGVIIVPLWDVNLCAEEVRRCASKNGGAVTVAFTENPARQELPSIHTDYWDPFFAACEETGTVISMHIGTSGMFSTGPESPPLVSSSLTHVHSSGAFTDWLLSGNFVKFPELKISLAEGQIGWMPYQLERMDKVWEHNRAWGEIDLPEAPSSYVAGHVFGCIFDDEHGLANRDVIGMKQIMFETDYPHSDSTWPHCGEVAERLVTKAGLSDDETYALLRGNAIECFNLGRFGVVR